MNLNRWQRCVTPPCIGVMCTYILVEGSGGKTRAKKMAKCMYGPGYNSDIT